MKTYSGDPYWMTAKYPGTCAKSGVPFKKGERVFYYPRTRQAYVGAAAEAAARDFEACAQDEAVMSGESW